MPCPILHSSGGGIEGAWTKCGHNEGRPVYTCRDQFVLAHLDGLWRVFRRRVGDDGTRIILATAVSLRAHPTTIAKGEWWDAAGKPIDLNFSLAIHGSAEHPIDFEDMGEDFFEHVRRTRVVWYQDPAFGVQHSGCKKIGDKEGMAWCCICSRLVPKLSYKQGHGAQGHVTADTLNLDDVCDLYAQCLRCDAMVTDLCVT